MTFASVTGTVNVLPGMLLGHGDAVNSWLTHGQVPDMKGHALLKGKQLWTGPDSHSFIVKAKTYQGGGYCPQRLFWPMVLTILCFSCCIYVIVPNGFRFRVQLK